MERRLSAILAADVVGYSRLMGADEAGTVAVVGAVALRRPSVALVPLVAYSTGAAAVAYRLSDSPGVAPHRAALALGTCHWAYGLGFWSGVARIVRGKPFDSRPTVRR